MAALPDILSTDLVELRRRRPEYAEALTVAIGASYPELHRWLEWAGTMPSEEETRALLASGEVAFEAGEGWSYLLVEPETGDLVGAAGLYQRVGPDGIELGYSVRTDRTGRGYATAATRALADAAFAHLPEIQRIEIRMDKTNQASAAVPRKLGYQLDREEASEPLAPGDTGTDLVWVLPRPA